MAVTVTVLAPRSEQPKLLAETLKVTLEQLSEAELTSCAIDKLANPFASRAKVTGIGDRESNGAILSCIITIIVADEILPLAS